MHNTNPVNSLGSTAVRSLLERLGLGPRQVGGGQEKEPRDLVELYLGESHYSLVEFYWHNYF